MEIKKGDGEATISVDEQVGRTVEEIIKYLDELKKIRCWWCIIKKYK